MCVVYPKYMSTNLFFKQMNNHKTWKTWKYSKPGNEKPEKREDGFWQTVDGTASENWLDLVYLILGEN